MTLPPASGARLSPKVAILDRDGTLIDLVHDELHGTVHSAAHPSEVRLLPGAVTGLRQLQESGWVLAVVARQSSRTTREATMRVNRTLVAVLAAAGVRIAHISIYFDLTPDVLFDTLDALEACPSQAVFVATHLEAAHIAGIDGALVFAKEPLVDAIRPLITHVLAKEVLP